MKILTVCAGGSCRSVAMLYELRDRYGHDGLHCGHKPVGDDTLRMLCDWAEMILVADVSMIEKIPEDFHQKTHGLGMPRDKWHNPMDKKLRKLIRDQICHHKHPKVRALIPG